MVSRRALAVLRPRWMLWWSGWVDRGMRAVRVGGGGGRVVEPFLVRDSCHMVRQFPWLHR